MIEFIKSYYQYILVGLAVVILLVLTLISIFKKDNKEKKEGIIEKLAKSNKDKAVKETYKSEFVVFKKNLQNYYL